MVEVNLPTNLILKICLKVIKNYGYKKGLSGSFWPFSLLPAHLMALLCWGWLGEGGWDVQFTPAALNRLHFFTQKN
ncbi:hypothetical protein U2150_05320 [Methanothermobacter wolfeii]|uniref:Transposase n=1 Tax=Methanothermobacter wolfeii TaxID=145261 RepID=A0ABU8TWX4_METWO|nr:hypothetical protein [Methanothermobacter defluvii]